MIPWMVYAALTTVLIAAGALALERLVASTGRSRRFVWLAALTLAVVVPLLGGRREPPPAAALPSVATGEPVALDPVAVRGDQSLFPPLPNIPASRAAARTAGIAWGASSAASLIALCTVLVVVACAQRRWPRRRVDGTDVYLSCRFGPALVGIVAPKPVIPSWVLEEAPAARATILRHEKEHARARDHLALLYAALVAAAFPWSPAIWWMCRRLRAAIEIDCDQRVIASGIGAADYGALLLQAGARSRGRWGLVPAMSRPASILERRLRTMNKKTKKLNAAHGVALGAATLAAFGIACDLPAPTQLDTAIDELRTEGREVREGEAEVPAPPTTTEVTTLVLLDGEQTWEMEPTASRFLDRAIESYLESPEGRDGAFRTFRVEVMRGRPAKEGGGIELTTARDGLPDLFIYENGSLRTATPAERSRYAYWTGILYLNSLPEEWIAETGGKRMKELVDFTRLFGPSPEFENGLVWRKIRGDEIGRLRAVFMPVKK